MGWRRPFWLVLLLLAGTAVGEAADAPAPPGEGESDATCQKFFGSIQQPMAACKTVLATLTVDNDSQCPTQCHGMFNDLPPECALFVNRTLPQSYKGPPAAGNGSKPFDICDRMYCPQHEDQCGVPLELLRSLDLFRLPYLVGSSASSGSSDGGSSSTAAIVAGVLVGNAVIVAVVAAFMYLHRRRQKRKRLLDQAATQPPAAGAQMAEPSGSSSFALGSDKLGDMLDSAECGGGTPGMVGKHGGVAIVAAAAAPYAGSDAGTTASSGILAGTPQSPHGMQGVANLWAAAAARSAAAPSAPRLAPSPFLSTSTTMTDHMQQDEVEMMRLGSAASGPQRQSVVQNDPLLTWVHSQLQPEGQGSGQHTPDMSSERSAGAPTISASSSQRRASGLVDLKPWQLKYSDLRIQRPLGEGSFGKVFLATWNETLVAVKLLISTDDVASGSVSASLSLPLPVMEALQKEAGLMASLRHPNVVLFLGVCSSPPAVVTEYCSRGSLLDVLRNAQASPQAAQQLTWVRRLSMALDAAKGMLCLHVHNPPILHRDLKSPNLLVDAAWRVKVCDFNLSKLLEESVRSSSAGGLLNPRWLAPEVLMGGSATAASDVFSFGTVLWELLTWQLPWEGANLYQLVFMVSRGERLAIPSEDQMLGGDQLPPNELAAYVALIRRCWAQEPAERPTFTEAIIELRGVLSRLLGAMASGSPTALITPSVIHN